MHHLFAVAKVEVEHSQLTAVVVHATFLVAEIDSTQELEKFGAVATIVMAAYAMEQHSVAKITPVLIAEKLGLVAWDVEGSAQAVVAVEAAAEQAVEQTGAMIEEWEYFVQCL